MKELEGKTEVLARLDLALMGVGSEAGVQSPQWGRWEGGSGWGIHVKPWLIYVNV